MTTLDDLAAAAEKAQCDVDDPNDPGVCEDYGVKVDPTTVLRLVAVARAAQTYSPERNHDWRCEYRTAEVGWQPGDSPVIRCECGYDDLRAALAALDE